MKKTTIAIATIGALALTAVGFTKPAEARHGIGPGIIGGVIAGAAVAGAASSAYAWDQRRGYGAYDSYDAEPGYYGRAPYGYSRGYGDESQHGGQPYYGQ